MSNLKSVLFAVFVPAFLASAPCSAQKWIQMKGDSFALTPEMISEVKDTLRDQVYQKINPPRDWDKYLLQFRAVRISGRRAIEIHGACAISPATKLDLETEFYEVADGGSCYFQVIYDLDSKRYSNVLFNRVA